jgi:hypothetical protein
MFMLKDKVQKMTAKILLIIISCALGSFEAVASELDQESHPDLDMKYRLHSAPVTFDLSLLTPYNPSIQQSLVATFDVSGLQLCYLGVGHCHGSRSPVHKMILRKLDKVKPSLIILEGFNGTEESTRMAIWEINTAIERVGMESWLEQCDEVGYAIHLAKERGIKIIGGEPEEKEVVEIILKRGFTKQDLTYFYMSRYIPQLAREGKAQSLQDLPVSLASFMNGYLFKHITFEDHELPTFETYQSWLRQHYQKDLSFEEISNPMLTYPDPNGKDRLKEISCAVTLVRDQSILTTILNSFNANNRVMTVYGSGHLFAQEKVLENYLGKGLHEEVGDNETGDLLH